MPNPTCPLTLQSLVDDTCNVAAESAPVRRSPPQLHSGVAIECNPGEQVVDNRPRRDSVVTLDQMAKPDLTIPAAAEDENQDASMPWAGILTVSLVMFCNGFLFVVIFPFMSSMVTHLVPTSPPTSPLHGTLTGWLTSSMMLGGLVSSYPWGALSDRVGRRPAMLLGTLATPLAMLAFGAAPTYAWALVWRVVLGVTSGVVSVCRAQMAELCPGGRRRAKGFGVLVSMWSAGMVVGPLVGGALARPAERWPDSWVVGRGTVWEARPYALVGVTGALITLLCSLAILLWLPETRPRPGPSRLPRILTCAILASQRKPSSLSSHAPDPETRPLATNTAHDAPPTPLHQLLTTRPILTSLLMYTGVAAVEIAYLVAVSLWSQLPATDGGTLHLSVSDLGFITSIAGMATLGYQVLVYPALVTWVRPSPLAAYRVAVLGGGLVYVVTPHVVNAVTLAVLVSVAGMCMATGFTSVFVVMANVTVKDADRGVVNGIGQGMASAARIVFPVVSGAIFSTSMSLKSSVGTGLVFYLTAVIAAGLFGGSFVVTNGEANGD